MDCRLVLGFACVCLLVSAGVGAVETGLPAARVPDCLGVNIHFVGAQDEQVKKIAEAGFRFIRMDVIWSNVESKKGVYDFAAYDQLVESLAKHGIRPLFILCYTNALYDDGLPPHTDEGRTAFAAFANAAAQRFKGKGVLWEIWNEPNIVRFWKPEPSPADYVKLVRVSHAAIKKADPSAPVLALALSSWDYAFIESTLKLGLLDSCDAISLHPYGAPKPEDAGEFYSRTRELIRQYGPKDRTIPVVSGEWGYPAVGDTTVEKQAEYLTRMFISNMMNGIPLSIWYDWRDDGPDPNEPEHHFGTLYQDSKEKPAYFAAKTLTRELDGYEYAARIGGDSERDYLVLFRRGDDHRLAAWTTGEEHKARLPLDVDKVEIVSMTGERTESEVDDGYLTLQLGPAVQYIEPKSKSRRWQMEAAWTIAARTEHTESGIVASVESHSPGIESGELSISGVGLPEHDMQVIGAKPSTLSASYVCSGDSKARVKVTLKVEGLQSPLVRVVELDLSACPMVQVRPPANNELWFIINRPKSEPKGPFKGAIYVGNTRGLRLETESCRFEIPDGEDRTTARIRLSQEPEAVYSFSYRLLDVNGRQILRARTRRYSMNETFANGKAGDDVRKYQVELDGDAKVPASAKLTYLKSPKGAPEDLCAKLDYEFDDGWRFVRVSPRPMIPIGNKPTSVLLWIKGDGLGGLARLRFQGSDGQVFQQDYGKLDFTDWRCLEAKMTGEGAGHWGGKNDGVVRYPISWDTVFLLDSAGGVKRAGAVCLGSMMLVYE